MVKLHCLSNGLALTLGLALASLASAQTSLSWVKDINTTPVTVLTASDPDPSRSYTGENSDRWIQMGKYFYFQATNGKSGSELFKSDGTTTTLVKDIVPGANGSSPAWFARVGSKIYFSANTSAGAELWVTDGTGAGTVMVKDIRPGSSGSSPYNMTRIGSRVVFTADDGTSGTELWVSDGTAVGTRLLKDIRPGAVDSSLHHFRGNLAGNRVFFQASNGTHGPELWVTDGTSAGTKLVKDIRTGSRGSYPGYLQPLGQNKVVFQADDGTNGRELWVSDGTLAGTTMVRDIYPGISGGTSTRSAVSIGSKVLFLGSDAVNGAEPWITDGTAAGTRLLKDVHRGLGSSYMYFSDADGGKAWWGCVSAVGKYEIWVTDGTPAGTRRFSSPKTNIGWPYNIAATGGKVFFCGSNVTAGTGYELCMTDGKTTKTVKDIKPGASSGLVRTSNYIATISKGTVAFRADDGNGPELWVSKGTSATTRMLDINKWIGPPPTADDIVGYSVPFFGRVIFAATDGKDKTKGQHGRELWISDGTAANTKLLKDIWVGSSPTLASDSWPMWLVRLGNYVYFTANDGASGIELWRTDGTAAGTMLYVDINPGSPSSYPNNLTRIGDKIYFSAFNGKPIGSQLWVTDGTVAGTTLVKAITRSHRGGRIGRFARLGLTNKVLFAAQSLGKGHELWITDGTPTGTRLLKDIYPGYRSSSPDYLTSYKGRVYFQASTEAKGSELWGSDGTAAGTALVKDGVAGRGSGYAISITVQNGKLYYKGYTAASSFEIHSSDGTAANTGLYWDLAPGRAWTNPMRISAVGSRRLYFHGDTGAKGWGWEPMSIDVTNKTQMIWNANADGSNLASGFTVDGGSVYGAAMRSNYRDFQLFRITNGATAQSIGRAQSSSVLTATDPRIGKSMIVKGSTAISNPLNVLCLGVPDNKPAILGTLVPKSYAYFKMTTYFLIARSYTGTAYSSVFSLPNTTSIIGTQAVLQSFSLNTSTFPAKTEITNGVHITIGR